MANNPVSFVDPDGGRAVMTEYMKQKILRHLFDNKANMTRIEWLRGWMSATGMNHYQGVTFEDIYSILGTAPRGGVSRYSTGGSSTFYDFSDNYAALNGLLGPLGGGFLDAPSMAEPPGGNNTGTSGLSDADSKVFIDGLEVSNFAYNAFVDNTLREDIIQVASSNVSFGYSAGKYYDNSQGAFGSGKTNREVREEQNRENRAYAGQLEKLYELYASLNEIQGEKTYKVKKVLSGKIEKLDYNKLNDAQRAAHILVGIAADPSALYLSQIFSGLEGKVSISLGYRPYDIYLNLGGVTLNVSITLGLLTGGRSTAITPINFYGGSDAVRRLDNSYWDIYKGGGRYELGVRVITQKEGIYLLEWLNIR